MTQGYKWIFDVLADLKSFAELNGMPGLSDAIAEAEATARDEVGAKAGTGAPGRSPPEPSRHRP